MGAVQVELELVRKWDEARAHESAGAFESAMAEYHSIVSIAPGHVPAWLRLSVLEQAADHYRTSLARAMSAARAVAATQAWQHLSAVTMRLLRFHELAHVRELIHAADWSSAVVIRQSPVLSQHLWLAGDYEGALRLIDQAASRVAPNHLLRYSRANALRYSGRMDEAAEELERCIALAPNYGPAHWSLAYHRPATPLGARVDRVRAAIAQVPEGSLEEADLQFALFKELDDLGATDEAWQALTRGASVKRATLRHDAKRQAEGFRRLREMVGGDWLDMPASEPQGHVPLFVVGMPRTGTTLLERVLGNHSQVSSAGELNDFSACVSWAADHFFAGADVPGSLERIGHVDFHKVGQMYLGRTARHGRGRRFVVDKNPVNFANAGLIAKALPSAKIICMVKRPMDACFSNFKELFDGAAYSYSYDLDELAEYHAEFSATVDHWQRHLAGRFHVVEYESMVAHPEETAREVMSFCGLPFEEGCTQIERNSNPVATASSAQVRQPIHARFVEAWRPYADYLRPLEAVLDEAAAAAHSA